MILMNSKMEGRKECVHHYGGFNLLCVCLCWMKSLLTWTNGIYPGCLRNFSPQMTLFLTLPCTYILPFMFCFLINDNKLGDFKGRKEVLVLSCLVLSMTKYFPSHWVAGVMTLGRVGMELFCFVLAWLLWSQVRVSVCCDWLKPTSPAPCSS